MGSHSDPTELKAAIREAALGLGFDQVGFAPAEPPANASALQDWIAAGYHGDMAYMAREDTVRRRLDPTQALPNCRTLIMVSLVYGDRARAEAGHATGPEDGALRHLPVVAGYAHGRDYHDVFEERLDALAERLTEMAPGASTKRYVDYGPVLERDHAQRAGLGWIGKNTMLIHPRLGSYLMLGELLTDLEIPPDDPFTHDRCGTCTRCIEACPTDAILDGRVVDARACISYLTIELRGSIPERFRPAIGTRVFGCDICQEVCPWNSDAPSPEVSPFAPKPGQPMPPESLIAWAEELHGLSDDAFKERYRGTAFERTGRDGLLRNVAVALGNVGGGAAEAMLGTLTADRTPLVREHARWSLEALGHRRPEAC